MNNSLISLNLKGNAIRDEGLEIIALALEENVSLESLNISLNEITPFGIQSKDFFYFINLQRLL